MTEYEQQKLHKCLAKALKDPEKIGNAINIFYNIENVKIDNKNDFDNLGKALHKVLYLDSHTNIKKDEILQVARYLWRLVFETDC